MGLVREDKMRMVPYEPRARTYEFFKSVGSPCRGACVICDWSLITTIAVVTKVWIIGKGLSQYKDLTSIWIPNFYKANTVARPSHRYDDNTYTQKEGLDIATRTRLLDISPFKARAPPFKLFEYCRLFTETDPSPVFGRVTDVLSSYAY